MTFLNIEKSFDRVNRKQLWQILNRRGIPYHLIEVIKSLYKNNSVQIDTGRKILEKKILIKEYDKGVIYHGLFSIFI